MAMASSVKLVPRVVSEASRPSIQCRIPQTLIPQYKNRSTPVQTSRRTSSALTTTQRFQPKASLNTSANASSRRLFSTTPHSRKTMGQIKTRHSNGPFSWKAALLLVLTGAGMLVYFRHEKERLARKRIAELSKGVGKPKVGGPFVLKDLDGKEFTSEDLKGKYSFVYFGFTHCPDICPDELDKMGGIINRVQEATKGENIFTPVFITCDPFRDTPEVLRAYLKEFHPDIIGLTGTYEQVKNVCKQYRVYFSTPRNVKPGEDYLVDHSIYFYLMDPEGDFVECIGRQDTPETATATIMDHINDWKREGKPLNRK